MPHIFPGRYQAETGQPFVVFLIGMRVNRLLALRKWVTTALAMGPMLRTLFQHPEKGLLGARTYLGWREVVVVQYWRSLDDLMQFARNSSDPHLSAWKRFNKAVGSDGSVGIWHETYEVTPDRYETTYVNMPRFGLAGATNHAQAGSHKEKAAARR